MGAKTFEVMQATRITVGTSDLIMMLQPRVTSTITRFAKNSIRCDGKSIIASCVNNVLCTITKE